jgi:hypothetical protein
MGVVEEMVDAIKTGERLLEILIFFYLYKDKIYL